MDKDWQPQVQDSALLDSVVVVAVVAAYGVVACRVVVVVVEVPTS